MSNQRKAQTVLLLLCVALCCAIARAQNPFETKKFSATVVMSGIPGKSQAQSNMTIYRSGDMMRMNMAGDIGYVIMDLTKNTNYMVMNGMCMQMSAMTQPNPFSTAQDAKIERSPAGSDTVDGHACKVENMTITPRDGQPTKMKVWEAEDLKSFPVKVQVQSSHGPVTIQYKDISFAEPAASLFTHPENCQQMPTMPGRPQ